MICTCYICEQDFDFGDFYSLEEDIEDFVCDECAETAIEWIIKQN